MARACPLCGLALVRAAPAEYHCPRCSVRLRSTVRPAGYAALALLALAAGACATLRRLHPPALAPAWVAPVALGLVALACGAYYLHRGRRLSTVEPRGEERPGPQG